MKKNKILSFFSFIIIILIIGILISTLITALDILEIIDVPEKYSLTRLNHQNIVKLNKTFQDKRHLYFVLEFCQNKDLGSLIRLLDSLDYNLAKYYSA